MILGAAFPNIFSIVRCKLSALVLRPSGPIRCLTWRSSIVFGNRKGDCLRRIRAYESAEPTTR